MDPDREAGAGADRGTDIEGDQDPGPDRDKIITRGLDPDRGRGSVRDRGRNRDTDPGQDPLNVSIFSTKIIDGIPGFRMTKLIDTETLDHIPKILEITRTGILRRELRPASTIREEIISTCLRLPA